MKTDKQILKIAEQLQDDCHKVVEAVMKEGKKVSYQDAANVWLFNKLAEFENRIKELENTNPVFGNSK